MRTARPDSERPRRLGPLPLLAAGLLLAALALACARGLLEDTGPYPEVSVQIRGWRGTGEVTDTPERHHRGLSGRPALPANRGLLFPYDPPARPRFWMLEMLFDIDIVWIRSGRVVDLSLDCPHDVPEPLPRYQSREPVDLVLEVRAGTARRFGWQVGDAVRLDPWPP